MFLTKREPMTIKNLDRICLAVGVLLIATAGTTALSMARRAKGALARESNELSTVRLQHADTQAKRRRLVAAVSKHQQNLDLVESRLLNEGQIGLFLEAVGALINDQGVQLRDLSPQTPVRENQYLRRPIRLSCEGTVPDIHRFLFLLETMPRVLRIDEVRISGTPKIALCRLDLQASLYERPRS